MGYIQINTVTFSPTVTSPQNVKIEYKVAGALGPYNIHSASTNANTGTFTPAVLITGLTDGVQYTVRITPLCGGTAFVENFFAGSVTTTTTIANTSNAFIGSGRGLTNRIKCL